MPESQNANVNSVSNAVDANQTIAPTIIAPISPLKKKGRPKGTTGIKHNPGMALSKRLKVLQKIALDTHQKSTDRIAAINLITQLLNDKVKDQEAGVLTTVIKFDNNDKIKENKVEVKESKPVIKPPVISPTTTTTTATLAQVVAVEPVMKNDVMKFDFKIEKNNEQYKDV